MPELSEIVFEDISTIELSKLAEDLLCQDLKSVTFNGEDFSGQWISHSKLTLLSKMNNDSSIFLNLGKLILGSMEIPRCSAQILKYGDIFDLNLIFEIGKLTKRDDQTIACILRDSAQEVAKKYKVSNFYGGLEPASDRETRYFTNSELRIVV